jgi:hypothetical protein
VGDDYLIATHPDQSNYLANQKQGAVNKYDLTVFFQEAVHFSGVTAVFQ